MKVPFWAQTEHNVTFKHLSVNFLINGQKKGFANSAHDATTPSYIGTRDIMKV